MSETIAERLDRFIRYEREALSVDSPDGGCASSHRQVIRAYERVKEWMNEEESIAECGHPERYWKVEPDNATAWCLQCAVDKLAEENGSLRKQLENWKVQLVIAVLALRDLRYEIEANYYPNIKLIEMIDKHLSVIERSGDER